MRPGVRPLADASGADETRPGDTRPRVLEQLDLRVAASFGNLLHRGLWVRVGDTFMGVVRRHERAKGQIKAYIDLVFEQANGVWGPIRGVVPLGALVEQLDCDAWAAIQEQKFRNPVPVGRIWQPGLEAAALMPDPTTMRTLVLSISGGGTSTVINTILTNWRNGLHLRGPQPGRKPFLVTFDNHGDYIGGRVHDADHKPRPALAKCLLEEVVVIGPEDFSCSIEDIPAPLLLGAVEDLSSSQRRWGQMYIHEDGDHAPIKALVGSEDGWAEAFPEFATDGVLAKSARDSLRTLRMKLNAILKPPLFQPETARSTYNRVTSMMRCGRVLIFDLSQWPASQQELLVVLVLRTILDHQKKEARAGRQLQPAVIAADEMHRLRRTWPAQEEIFREARKLFIGTLFGSQALDDFPPAVKDNASSAVVLLSEGDAARSAIRRWPALKHCEHELHALEPGHGFFLGRFTAWPIKFDEAKKPGAASDGGR